MQSPDVEKYLTFVAGRSLSEILRRAAAEAEEDAVRLAGTQAEKSVVYPADQKSLSGGNRIICFKRWRGYECCAGITAFWFWRTQRCWW